MTLTFEERRQMAQDTYTAYLAECPARQLLDMFSTKWTTLVLYQLNDGPLRHSELRRRIPGASQKMITETLRSLERDGIIVREVKQVYPAHVEYSLTPLGESMLPIFSQMKIWAEQNMAEVERNRAAQAGG